MNLSLPYKLMENFLRVSKDGYAIFDAQDNLLYCNEAFADIMFLDMSSITGQNWERLVKHAFSQRRGIKIDSDDVEAWLRQAALQRRQREFRIFEVDLVDGRWMLFSEQMLASGEVLVTTKNLTRQKMLETQLQNSVSELQELAATDELTQVFNRRAFRAAVDREIANIANCNEDSSLIVLDLDYFKLVNDNFGHAAGDAVLKAVSQRIREDLRPHDLVGRLGGEEFAIFLSCVKEGECASVAERIRASIEAEPVQFNDIQINVTASLGLVRANAMTPFEALYPLADAALYQAKANGRNQLVIG